MLEQIIHCPRALARMQNYYLSELLEIFTKHLQGKGYSLGSILHYLESVEHFLRWLDRKNMSPSAVSEETVQVFLSNHLPECHCPPPAPRCVKTMRAALHQLLPTLPRHQLPDSSEFKLTEIDVTVRRFDAYLEDVCGLAASTRLYRQRHAREFLTALFGTKNLDFNQITAQKVTCYVVEQARRYKSGNVGQLTGSIRSYLKFLQFNGHCTASLAAAVPSIPNWSFAKIPQTLSKMEVEKFLSAFDRSIASGLRDYAMARCMTDLGLRCSEVAGLHLENIDWRAGTLCVFRGKSRHADRLPLTDLLGKALAEYLAKGRPKAQTRAIFVYHRPPLGEGVKPSTVREAIRRGYVRSGIHVPSTGTHILRHTLATQLLCSGATLKEVADVLRHRCLDTTTIYTKIDVPHLTQVALPWPRRLS